MQKRHRREPSRIQTQRGANIRQECPLIRKREPVIGLTLNDALITLIRKHEPNLTQTTFRGSEAPVLPTRSVANGIDAVALLLEVASAS